MKRVILLFVLVTMICTAGTLSIYSSSVHAAGNDIVSDYSKFDEHEENPSEEPEEEPADEEGYPEDAPEEGDEPAEEPSDT
ncbi:MAG: hypothetical protein GTN99_03530 [Candidatus Dadabacteria bacterium]|nr:hypothetical protein [Candidatus Dadabacteria bacterium]NIT13332.1 hypothetical protein [Candidatus Dadabacteria bacterium]